MREGTNFERIIHLQKVVFWDVKLCGSLITKMTRIEELGTMFTVVGW
jgi:hypothetical protein